MYQAADSSSSLCIYKSSSSSKGKERANERNKVFLNFYLTLGQNFRTMIGLWSNKKFKKLILIDAYFVNFIEERGLTRHEE